ncbi:MAG: hypothetical protein WAU07_00900, partial [Microgenomates group bacterium]
LFILAVGWLIVRTIKDRRAKPKPLTPKVIDRSASEITSMPTPVTTFPTSIPDQTPNSPMMQRIREKGITPPSIQEKIPTDGQ